MTIEKAHASSEAKPAAASNTKGTKGKSAGTEQTDAGGAGGFMAVLAAMDTAVAPTITLTNDEESPLSSLPVLQDGSMLASTLTPAASAALEADSNVPMDATALLAQSLQWSPVQAEPTLAPATVAPLNALGSSTKGTALRPPSDALAPNALSQPSLVAESTLPTTRKPGKGLPEFAANQAAIGTELAGVAASNTQADAQALSKLQKAEDVFNRPSPVDTALATAVVAVRREDKVSEHTIFKSNATEGAQPPQALPTGAPATAVLTASAVVPPSDVYVAEQVKYWISSDVKNAEMTLDGIGNSPVEVSISMQGNEAQVAFRTDELRAREVLENASTHLKDMLQREGLVLSGVSVDTAGAGNQGAQDRKAQQGGRQASVISMQPISANALPPTSRTSGRALDLFV